MNYPEIPEGCVPPTLDPKAAGMDWVSCRGRAFGPGEWSLPGRALLRLCGIHAGGLVPPRRSLVLTCLLSTPPTAP